MVGHQTPDINFIPVGLEWEITTANLNVFVIDDDNGA